MIGNSLWDFIKIRTGIAALQLIAPTSSLYLAACAFKPHLLFWPLTVYCSLEVAFYVFIYLPRKRRFQQPPGYVPPNLTKEQRLRIVRHCIETGFYTSSPNSPYPSCWFLPHNHASPASRSDVRDWLAWALFSISGKNMPADIKDELDEYITLLEEESGASFAEEYTSDAKELRGIRVSLDPVLTAHRPLLWYMIVAAVDTYTSTWLFLLGFKHYTPSEPGYAVYFPPRPILHLLSQKAPPGIRVPFWYRPHRSLTKNPLVFIHGIGIGLFPYITFFKSVTQGEDGDVGVILPELLPISMHMTRHTVPPRPDILRTLQKIVDYIQSDDATTSGASRSSTTPGHEDAEHPLLETSVENKAGWNNIVLAGHSYGTFIAGWVIREYVDYLVASELHAPPTSLNTPRPTKSSAGRPVFFADRISHFVLVDPIPILLSNPAVAYNFLYRKPSTVCPRCHNTICNAIGSAPDKSVASNANALQTQTTSHRPPSLNTQATYTSSQSRSVSIPSYVNTPHPLPLTPKCPGAWYSSAAAWQLWYFASRDADVARTLFRSFFWAEGGVWRDDLRMVLNAKRDGPHRWNGDRSQARIDRAIRSTSYGSMSPSPATYHNPNTPAVQLSRSGSRKHRKIAVVLAGLDQIIPAEAVRHHLTQTDEWADKWVGRVNSEGQIREVEDGDLGLGSIGGGEEVRIRVDRVDDGFSVAGSDGASCVDGDEDKKGTLEVLFNPHLDHASIFDSEIDSVPLVDVVRRYIRDL